MRDFAEFLFRAVERLQSAGSVAALRDSVQAAIEELGFRYLTCATVRNLRSLYLHEANFQTWPEAAVKTFAQGNLFRHDPVIERSRTESSAFFWSLDAYDPTNEHHAQILAIRHAAGVTGGCCAPVPERVGGQVGGRMVLYLTGDAFERSEGMRLCVQLLAPQVAARLAGISDHFAASEEKVRFYETTGLLSGRERTILSWVASGKSSWEIARILAISEHTVNTHIEKALVKLDAANRTEAVARAMVLNEVRLDPELA